MAKSEINFTLVDANLLYSIIKDLQALLLNRVDLIPVPIAAEMLDIKPQAVRHHIKSGKLKAEPIEFGSTGKNPNRKPRIVWYVKQDSLQEMIQERKKRNRMKPGPKSKREQGIDL